jgi:hypothetical protein
MMTEATLTVGLCRLFQKVARMHPAYSKWHGRGIASYTEACLRRQLNTTGNVILVSSPLLLCLNLASPSQAHSSS